MALPLKSMELPPEPSKPRYAVSEFQIDNDALAAPQQSVDVPALRAKN
jgi:hypothetical protein